MTKSTKLVIAALALIGVGLIMGNMYTIVHPPNSFAIMKINNFTGHMQMCNPVKGCYSLDGEPTRPPRR
jgi:hypothetical protein